ncbi:DUF4157 domain-containing protein [Actinophytocola oryzae]|uniref:Uncharacterized protein DUF4157 n=1 Tax=Actinophytocola oryzae TaxID=502181 RepID=A0A4R7VHA4_9PSEU|nr:DUF4157 domain-containing protein [Actinophytocola oryzae]TDV48710.1 uncharacterized protein DUF4157 [Actinophytocola oryzae]
MHEHEEQREDRSPVHRTKRTDSPTPDLPTDLRPASVVGLQQVIGNVAVSRLLDAERDRAGQDQDAGAAVHDVLRTPGRPLPEPVRADMEARLGADFSDVRVHTDHTAHESAESVDSQAYTSGSHIVFRQGRYDTASETGRRTLAHELTHVVQQRSGPVEGTDAGDGLAVSDPSDRFEREAIRVAAQAVGGGSPAITEAAGSSSHGTPVARLMTAEQFKKRTKGGTFRGRGDKIELVEAALVAYHAIAQDNYVARRAQLEVLRDAADTYLTTSTKRKHQATVDVLVEESHTESYDLRLLAVVQETLERATGHLAVYQVLNTADQEADPTAKLRHLQRAQDLVVTELDRTNAADDSDLATVSTKLGEWMNLVAADMDQNALRPFIGDDLRELTRMSTDQTVPQVTREILTELLVHQSITQFENGRPGTTLSPAGAAMKYTLKNPVNQPMGGTDRLGSLAHELTHVDAGEAYDNTPVLLLFKRGLEDDEIKQLAARRAADIDNLRTLLNAQQGLTAGQQSLFEGKLDYALRDRLKDYAAFYKSSNKIDAPTYDELIRLADLTKPNSGVLVEYDTVLNQLLVYLHRWGVDQQAPLYVETLRLAEQQRQERRS